MSMFILGQQFYKLRFNDPEISNLTDGDAHKEVQPFRPGVMKLDVEKHGS